MTKDKALATIPATTAAITAATEAGDVPALKAIRAELSGLLKYAKARGASIEQENTIAEAILRDERGIGKVLTTIMSGPQGGRAWAKGVPEVEAGQSRKDHVQRQDVVLLSDLGLSRMDSSNFQKLAAVPEDRFEAAFERIAAIKPPVRLAKVDFYRLDQSEKVKAEARKAIREEEQAGDDTNVFAAFEKAAGDLIDGISQLPNDELARVAATIKDLAAAYNAEKEARA